MQLTVWIVGYFIAPWLIVTGWGFLFNHPEERLGKSNLFAYHTAMSEIGSPIFVKIIIWAPKMGMHSGFISLTP